MFLLIMDGLHFIRRKSLLFFDISYKNISSFYCKYLFRFHGINCNNFISYGIPNIQLFINSQLKIGKDFVMINNTRFSTLGKVNKCKFLIFENAKVLIGDKVGMSNCTIISKTCIELGNNLLIGGGVTIVDTDFHSLNSKDWHTIFDEKNMVSKPVFIGNNVFIGMDSIILKGVTIGSNVIIAAGSVVSSNIPSGEIWGGNPAKFIKMNNNSGYSSHI